MFLTGHPSTPTNYINCVHVSCDHILEINLSLEQQANIVLYVLTLNLCSDYMVDSVIPILQIGK